MVVEEVVRADRQLGSPLLRQQEELSAPGSQSPKGVASSAHLFSSFLAFQGPRDLDVHMRPELCFLQNLIWTL